MHLRKYYLDLVTDDGRAFVWHWAVLRWPWRRWAPVRLSYAGELAWEGEAARSRSTVWAGPEPSLSPRRRPAEGEGRARRPAAEPAMDEPHSMCWRCRSLGVEGRWKAVGGGPFPGPTLDLLPEQPGAILWSCLLPSSTVEVHRHGTALGGVGYVERLDLAIAPWRLPIDTLRWGRLACDGRSLVWIGWQGARPQRLVLVDGQLLPASDVTIVDDALVAWRGGRVSLDQGMVMREERLAASLHGVLGGLRRVLPERVLAARETRWLSKSAWVEDKRKGESSIDAGSPRLLRGLAMHERVEFGGPA